MLNTLVSLVITCADLLIAPQPKPLPMVHFGPWVMHCPALPARCQLAEGHLLKLKQGQAWVKIYFARTTEGLDLIIETPPLAVPSVTFVIGEEFDLALETDDCNERRCRFHETLDYKKTAAVHRVESLTLVMTPEPDDTQKVAFDLDQFRRGLAALPEEY